MMVSEQNLSCIIEAALFAAEKPLTVNQISELFDEFDKPDNAAIEEALEALEKNCEGRAFELQKVASGYRFQVRQDYAPWVGRLWPEKPQKYSRALLETLSLIAYRQPITRGDIEDIRGVAVSSSIVKTLLEREWVRIVGHRDVPGRPAMYATTKQFLDYFNISNLDDLPPLSEIQDLDKVNHELDLEGVSEAELPEENVALVESAEVAEMADALEDSVGSTESDEITEMQSVEASADSAQSDEMNEKQSVEEDVYKATLQPADEQSS